MGSDRRGHDRAALERRLLPPGASRRRLARQPRANPPFIHNPIVYYNTLSNLFAPASRLANRPATVEALETSATTPSSINWSVGLRRELGWGTAVDATYTGYHSYATWRCITT